jgi:competence protein ComEC
MKKLKTKLKFKKILLLLIVWFLIYKFIKRSDLIGVIQRALPSGEGGLLAGMVWGEKGLISRDLYTMLKNTGLVHIVVVSGANLMIIGRGIIESLAKLLGRKMAIVAGGGIILIYVNLVGWQIPVVRAVLFLAIYYWAQMLGRQFRSGRALFLVVLIMFLADFKIFTEISFWLSVAAFLGVLLSREEGAIMSTIWVSLFILPILSIFFGKISLLTPVINLGVLFLVEAITIIGFWGSLIGLLWEGMGRVILSLSYPMLRYLIEVVAVTGKWSWTQLNFQFNWMMLVGWYLIIGVYWDERKKI